MSEISDYFCGYLQVGNDTCAYSLVKNVVTLLPAKSDRDSISATLGRLYHRNTTEAEFFFGVAESNYGIAFLRDSNFYDDFLMQNLCIRFNTPLIIKSSRNVEPTDLNYFQAITFYGGNINAIFNPRVAINPALNQDSSKQLQNGADEIHLRPRSDYTKNVDCELDGEKITITISVLRTGAKNDSEDLEAFSLGKLNAFIQFSFDKVQNVLEIPRLYTIVKSAVAILTAQNNVTFGGDLSLQNQDGKYDRIAECKFFNNYENYSAKKAYRVISLQQIVEYLPCLIEKLAAHQFDVLLSILPNDNRKVNWISINNIQDLCTCLEVAYGWRASAKEPREKDALVGELKKNIKTCISSFTKNHEGIDANKETTVSSCFKYLDITAKQKILTLYDENKETVDSVIAHAFLPAITENSVQAFLKLRNTKTHSGQINWGSNIESFYSLLVLAYTCMFKEIGMPEKIAREVLVRLF